MNNVWQITERPEKLQDAGPKALEDMALVLDGIGLKRFWICRHSSDNFIVNNLYRILWWLQAQVYRFRMPKDAILFIPYPGKFFTGKRMGFWFLDEKLKRKKNLKFVSLMVDINSQRFGDGWKNGEVMTTDEERFFRMSDILIAQNPVMRDWMGVRGYDKSKITVLGLWDYLSDAPYHDVPAQIQKRVSIAGNLNPEKCSYLIGLKEIQGVEWNLFGTGFDKKKVGAPNVIHRGSYSPDELPNHIDTDFGLVWDGDTIETCDGGFGHYLRLNCSHKLSLFLLLGIPVIIWKEAAAARYVEEYDCGWPVNSLRDVPDLLSAITLEQYAAKANNARKVAKKIRGGDYIRDSVRESLKLLGVHD